MAPNHLWGDWAKAPLLQPLCIFKICRGCTNYSQNFWPDFDKNGDSLHVHKTPPTPPQNTPFPCLILKVGKMNYCLGNLDSIWAKCLKSGQNFPRRGHFFFFIWAVAAAVPFSATALILCTTTSHLSNKDSFNSF